MIGGNKMPYTKSLRPGDLIGLESGLLQRKEDGSHMVDIGTSSTVKIPTASLSTFSARYWRICFTMTRAAET